jgi:DtxR family Mn-dependent transcriptional regulator
MEQLFDTTTQEYVEIIHNIQKNHKVARVKDIASTRGVTRSSVSTILNLLKEKALIEHESYGLVELTEKGEALARALERRHMAIKKFFIEILGIPTDIADNDACKMEHHISSETMDSLTRFLAFVEEHPGIKNEYLKQFKLNQQRDSNRRR